MVKQSDATGREELVEELELPHRLWSNRPDIKKRIRKIKKSLEKIAADICHAIPINSLIDFLVCRGKRRKCHV